MSHPSHVSPLHDLYATEAARIRQKFDATGDGLAVVRERAALVDAVVTELYRSLFCADLSKPQNFCVVAVGGYGRQELFPHSDIDLLFLSASGRTEASHKEAIAAICRALWDLRLRLGQTARTLAECAEFNRANPEFHFSLLDCRYLAGDLSLFAHLHDEVIPHVIARDCQDLVRSLGEATNRRHDKYGGTIFHLEPNLKEAPGGLRDYHAARWLALIPELEKHGRYAAPEQLWPPTLAARCVQALEFLSAARCFLHFHQGRDDNRLSYELQEQAAHLGLGHRWGESVAPADWMRNYFRHARSIQRLTAQLLHEATVARSSLYELFQDWRSRLSNADFSVVRGQIFPRHPAAVSGDLSLLLRMFEMMARHGLELSREAERVVEQALPYVAVSPPDLGRDFQRILVLPHAAAALRATHRLGLLSTLFPEFHAADCLVIRDFYHRYTVDEHSFIAIDNLHALRPPKPGAAANLRTQPLAEWEQRFSEIFSELEQPELLFLSLLFHDLGKAAAEANHIAASLKALEKILPRLDLEPQDQETVRFLVGNHLEMSATMQQRDVFDPDTARTFVEKVGTPERLKLLTLFTYADIQAVNPEALTPWKAELLWQLYMASANYLARNLDDSRLPAATEEMADLARVSRFLSPATAASELSAFLAGLPRRYVRTHSREEIAVHFLMARRLREKPVQTRLRSRKHFYELTVLTADRPFLFASISGTLAAWGMNILKADAYANTAGIVVDTFRFVDLFGTLALNPSEGERLEKSLTDVLLGKLSLDALMSGRINPRGSALPKIEIPAQVRFDNASSTHSTLLELITQDRPGLLYEVSSRISELGCNIEVALIDTEGPKVIDVFYLTWRGAKLDPATQESLRQALSRQLGFTSSP